jgi:hypothetical protein
MADRRSKTGETRMKLKVIVAPNELEKASNLRQKIRNLCGGLKFRYYNNEQVAELLIGYLRGQACVRTPKKGYILTQKCIEHWFKNRVLSSTVLITHKNKEMYYLMLFALAAAQQMWEGSTGMTKTEFSRRGKRRPLLQVVADIFTGKIGEVATQLLARRYGYGVQPDWDLSRDRQQYRSDLTRIGRITDGRIYEIYDIPKTWTISVKSSASLTGAWAEAPEGTRVALFWKVALPEDFLFRLLHYISSWTKLICFLEAKRLQEASPFNRCLEYIKKIERKLIIPCYFVGFYRPSKHTRIQEPTNLRYLGEVREPKHMCPIGRLRWKRRDFRDLLERIYCEASAGAGRPHGRT